jgi:hypothetical protein
MLKVSGPVRAALLVTATLMSANMGLSVDSARAENCAAAPKAAAPQGQHWYYHVDRATRHKCWYLHAAVGLHHRTMSRHGAAANADPQPDSQTAAAPVASSAPTASPAPSPAAPAPAPTPDGAADTAPPAPHVTVLAVKTSTPFVTATPVPQQNVSQNPPAPSAPQTLPHVEDTPAVATTKPISDTEGAGPHGKADAAFAAATQAAEAATTDERTKTAEMFILLAFALGIAAAVTAIVSKIIGIYRKPRISVDPDTAWLNFRSERQRIDAEPRYEDPDVPFLDPQKQYGLADLHTQEWLDRSAADADQASMSPPRNPDYAQPSPRPSQSDIEPALRALRQARQSR